MKYDRPIEASAIHCEQVPVDPKSMAVQALTPCDYADAHRVIVGNDLPSDPAWWAHQLMFDLPPLVTKLMRGRNAVAKRFGLAVPDDSATLPFPELARTESEILLGLDDAHLDFRCAIRVLPSGDQQTVTFETLVRYNAPLGRIYFLPVRPIHKHYVVPAMLRHVAAKAYAQRA